MRALCVLSLIAGLGIALISTDPLNESSNPKEIKPINRTEIDEIIKNWQLLEKLANETLYSPDPTSRDPTTLETQEPTEEDTKNPTGEETQEPTGEENEEPHVIHGADGEFYVVEEEEEEDGATLDKPTEAQPVNFLKYPKHAPDFKAYPRFAILRNSYVHHMNLDF
ncbi:uncharacterized protein LOC108035111 [Drosophila biarmipes]|uniref:uncharacterized protein LOC108035111 n=1 Tax=Drosophila biarmipes TaxID=125945 RepID=UPI0007E789B3|nr:uncharacterized protein LOC108035111 [Drosophila biarmipes]